MPNHDAAYHRNYRLRVKQRKLQQQANFEDIVLGDKPAMTNHTPLSYLLAVMNDETADPEIRAKAAIAAAPYVEKKASRRTAEDKPLKKELQQRALDKAIASGQFATSEPPKLKLVTNQDE